MIYIQAYKNFILHSTLYLALTCALHNSAIGPLLLHFTVLVFYYPYNAYVYIVGNLLHFTHSLLLHSYFLQQNIQVEI